MALTEDQRRLLVRYHDFLRQKELSVCERVTGPDEVVRHRQVRSGCGQDLILWFESWLEREQTGEQSEKEAAGG